MSIHLSIVIPAYNEEKRIGGTLARIETYAAKQDYAMEVVVVDDGSLDRTADIVKEEYPDVRLLSYPANRGKGYAVNKGMLAATGKFRVFYDADASTPIEEVEKLWPEFDAGAAVVIGSRALPGSEIEIRQPWYRENMGRIYNVILRCLGLTPFRDTQCGFKGFTAESCELIFPLQTQSGYGADCELLYIAKRQNQRIAEVPVRWLNSPETRVHAIYDSLDMLREIFTVRIKAFLGKYG